DPREGDRAPVEFGLAAARLTGSPLLIIAVQADHAVPPGHGDADLMPECAGAVAAVEHELAARDVRFACRIVDGSSASSALHQAAEEEQAALVVVGSSRRSPAGRVLAGLTAQRLLHG